MNRGRTDIRDIIANELVRNGESGSDRVPSSALDGKYIALYFGGSWCGKCQKLTPKMAATYTSLIKSDKPFEIVYVPGEQTKDEFEKFFKEMPWLAVQFESEDVRKSLLRKLGIKKCPSVLLFSPEWQLLNRYLQGVIPSDPLGKKFPWPEEVKPWSIDWTSMIIPLLATLYYAYIFLTSKPATA